MRLRWLRLEDGGDVCRSEDVYWLMGGGHIPGVMALHDGDCELGEGIEVMVGRVVAKVFRARICLQRLIYCSGVG